MCTGAFNSFGFVQVVYVEVILFDILGIRLVAFLCEAFIKYRYRFTFLKKVAVIV